MLKNRVTGDSSHILVEYDAEELESIAKITGASVCGVAASHMLRDGIEPLRNMMNSILAGESPGISEDQVSFSDGEREHIKGVIQALDDILNWHKVTH